MADGVKPVCPKCHETKLVEVKRGRKKLTGFITIVVAYLVYVAYFAPSVAESEVDAVHKLEQIHFNKITNALLVGETDTLRVTRIPEEATADLRWESSNPAIVAVENGVIKALAPGEVIVEAVEKGNPDIKDVCKLVVFGDVVNPSDAVQPESVEIANGNKLSLRPGEAFALSVIVFPTQCSLPLVWKTSDHNVVTVENGTVKAQGTGVATVSVKVGNLSASIKISVCEHP